MSRGLRRPPRRHGDELRPCLFVRPLEDRCVLSAVALPVTSVLNELAADHGQQVSGGHGAFVASSQGNNLEVSITGGQQTIDVGGFSASSPVNLTIRGSATDSIVLQGPINLDGGTLDVMAGSILVNGPLTSHGGNIDLDAGASGTLLVSAAIDVSTGAGGLRGGNVELLGNRVGLLNGAAINASGPAGGTVLVGGGEHGDNPNVLDATDVYVSPNASVTADAWGQGNGGEVVVWSNSATEFFGTINAQGGQNGGGGGFVEVSSGENLGFDGHVDLAAPGGAAGTLLLDPHNITVASGGTATYAQVDTFASTPSTDQSVDPATLAAVNGNVVLQANNDITVSNPIDLTTAGATLTLQAGRSIVIDAGLTTNNGAISLTANDTVADGVVAADRDAGVATITMATGTTINAGNANVTLTLSTGSTNNTSGNIVLDNLVTTGNVLVVNDGPTAGSSIVAATDSPWSPRQAWPWT